jgi:hypothetical protein
MLVKLHVIFLLGALLDERKKKTYTKQPMVKFASAPGGYFNYIYLIKPSESISDKHPIQKHHVLYFQLITIFKKICGQTFFFLDRTVICAQNIFASLQLQIGTNFDYFDIAHSLGGSSLLACSGLDITNSTHSRAYSSRIHHIGCVLFIDYFRPDVANIDCVCRTICFHIGSATPDKKLSVPPPRVNYRLLSPHQNTRGLCHYFVTTNILSYLVNFFSSALDISSPAQ